MKEENFVQALEESEVEVAEYMQFVGGKLSDDEGNLRCVCGSFHPVKKKMGQFRIICPSFNIKVRSATRPNVLGKWVKEMHKIIRLLKQNVEEINSNGSSTES
jgi:hypothetical protein